MSLKKVTSNLDEAGEKGPDQVSVYKVDSTPIPVGIKV